MFRYHITPHLPSFPTRRSSDLSSLAPADKRGQVIKVGDTTVINDCYNSNPKALDAMVDALATMPAARRIVVAGERSEERRVGKECSRQGSATRDERSRELRIVG